MPAETRTKLTSHGHSTAPADCQSAADATRLAKLRQWQTEPPPQLHHGSYAMQWGNQIPLFPISPKVLCQRASSRIEELARPKDFNAFYKALYRDLHLYSCGTPEPISPVSSAALMAVCPPRVLELSRPKTHRHLGGPDNAADAGARGQPEGNRSRSAAAAGQGQPYVPSDRLLELSRPKPNPPLPGWPSTFQKASAYQNGHASSQQQQQQVISERLSRLSIAPLRRQRERWSVPDVVTATWDASPVTVLPISERVEKLSRPKRLHPEYLFQFSQAADPIWPVPDAALNHVASERLELLSAPRGRPTMYEINTGPNRAFRVSPRKSSGQRRAKGAVKMKTESPAG